MRRHASAPGRVLGRTWRFYSPQCGQPFKDAGITQFLQEEPQGFTAALKRSLFDFQVHEIDLHGEEIHLGAMGAPPTLPDGDKWYLHFRLYKEGMDTLEAMSRLCRFLGRPPKNFRFAGHKDRCAVTVQQLSCTSLEPAKLLGVLEHQDWDHRLAFSHLEIKPNYLNLGDLSGNRFNVVMRQLPTKEPGDTAVERRCASLLTRGFLNYFGPQRFGSQLIRSDQIGAALLEHDFSRALRLILGDAQPEPQLPQPLLWDQAAKEAQEQVLTHWGSASLADAAKKALPLMPKRYNLERGVLKSLAQGLNAEETLQKLPRHLLMLYVKAAQSRIFNEVDANFKSISPQDMAALQLQLAQTEGDARKPLQRLLGSIQKAMESRMAAVTKDIEALMQSSGNIEENIRECLQKQESVLPMIAVLQMNIARARKAENEQLERALTFLYTTINEELESKVPMVNRVLSRCLSTEDAEPRRELLKAYFAEESEEDKPKLMADALLGLVKEAQEQKGQKGFDLKGALMRIRDVALDVGVAQGEVCDEEVSEKFLEAMGPLTDACAVASGRGK